MPDLLLIHFVFQDLNLREVLSSPADSALAKEHPSLLWPSKGICSPMMDEVNPWLVLWPGLELLANV